MSPADGDGYRRWHSSTSGLHHCLFQRWPQRECTCHHLRRHPGHHSGDGYSAHHCHCWSKGWRLASESTRSTLVFFFSHSGLRTNIFHSVSTEASLFHFALSGLRRNIFYRVSIEANLSVFALNGLRINIFHRISIWASLFLFALKGLRTNLFYRVPFETNLFLFSQTGREEIYVTMSLHLFYFVAQFLRFSWKTVHCSVKRLNRDELTYYIHY